MFANFSIRRRLAIGFGGMMLLVLLVSGTGLFYAYNASRTIETTQQSLEQVQQITDLFIVWMDVATTIDTILQTGQTDLLQNGTLDDQMMAFNNALDRLATMSLGANPNAVMQNDVIVSELQNAGATLNQVVAQIVAQIEADNFNAAADIRRESLAPLQQRYDILLAQLNTNIKTSINARIENAFERQRLLILFFVAAGVFAIGAGFTAAILSVRYIVNPIRVLNAQTKNVTAGDFNPITPSAQKDEVGELSRSFALMTDWLRESYQNLEDRVTQRTRRLAVVATLSKQLSAILDLEELLPQVVEQIKSQFDYYHAHIYLREPESHMLVVAEGTGPAGEAMKTDRHSIPLNAETSLVAKAARSGEVVRVDNVREAADWLPNPLLPNTYSEMAVPIILDDQVVGVLDVQEDEVAAFDESDSSTLQSLANQIAVAIRNARLFAQVESSLEESQTVQARYTEQSWAETKIAPKGGQYRYNRLQTEIDAEQLALARLAALTASQPTPVETLADSEQKIVVAPVSYRNTNIGSVQIYPAEDGRTWNEDELAVIAAVIDELGQTAENLRLFDATRERASREQLATEIGEKLRRSPDMATLMQTAAEELAHHLKLDRAFVQLDPDTWFADQIETTITQPSRPPTTMIDNFSNGA